MEFLMIIIGIIAVGLLAKFFSLSVSIIFKLVINGIVGGFTLLVLNWVGGLFNIGLEINAVNALMAGFFGFPGVILMLFIKYLL